ncbi:phosphohydrolase domain protein, partial [Chlamydia psittaci 84-8471/1]
AEVR